MHRPIALLWLLATLAQILLATTYLADDLLEAGLLAEGQGVAPAMPARAILAVMLLLAAPLLIAGALLLWRGVSRAALYVSAALGATLGMVGAFGEPPQPLHAAAAAVALLAALVAWQRRGPVPGPVPPPLEPAAPPMPPTRAPYDLGDRLLLLAVAAAILGLVAGLLWPLFRAA